jgi:hypothetical protein
MEFEGIWGNILQLEVNKMVIGGYLKIIFFTRAIDHGPPMCFVGVYGRRHDHTRFLVSTE